MASKKTDDAPLQTRQHNDEAPLSIVLRDFVNMKNNRRATVMTRFTVVLYMCGSILVYLAFSKGHAESCYGFCDKLTTTSRFSSSPSDSGDELREKQPLPSFANGGIIFWLHVPKTGGVTIRKALQRGNGQYLLADDRRKFDEHKKALAKYLKYGTDGQVVVFELHAYDSPPLFEMRERLHRWREIAERNNVPFFAFTVLREPVSFALSFFNFFHGMDHGDEHFEYYDTANEFDLLNHAVVNPQCGFLVQGDVIFHNKMAQQTVVLPLCKAAYETLWEEMDWIGTTAALSNETFPLLRSIVKSSRTNGDANHLLAQNIRHRNKSPDKVTRSDLGPRSIDQIRMMTRWDQTMYYNAQRDFPFDKMQLVEDQKTRQRSTGRRRPL